jgi:hypothetical protein
MKTFRGERCSMPRSTLAHSLEVTAWSRLLLIIPCPDMCHDVAFREYKDTNIPWGPQDIEALSHVEELRKVEPRLAVATQLLYRLRYELIAFGGAVTPSSSSSTCINKGLCCIRLLHAAYAQNVFRPICQELLLFSTAV